MIDQHLMLLRARAEISPSEEMDIRGTVAGLRRIAKKTPLVRAYVPLASSAILVSGLAARVKYTRDGRRQITEVHVPGDFVDLHSFVLKYLDHDVTALSDCVFAMVPHSALRQLTERSTHLTHVYWFTSLVDAAISREWELSFGRRGAVERMAHLFCELHVRLGVVGLAQDNAFDLPLTQSDLAECLGLSIVHVNRTLMQLRKDGLLEFAGGHLRIHNVRDLQEKAGFEPGYLYLDGSPAENR